VRHYEYRGLMATSWDAFRGDTSSWPDRRFYLEVIGRFGQPALDVGCGTGRLLLDYLGQGIDVDGVDISPEMLALCREKADRMGLRSRLYQQRMEELDLPRRYRCIAVPSSSFQLLLDPAQPPVAMRRFLHHLEPGGALVMPFMTLWEEGGPLESEAVSEAVRPRDGALLRRTARTRFDPETCLEHTDDRYEVVVNGRVVEDERHVRSPATRSYTQREARALYQEAGFGQLEVFSGFTSEPAGPDDVVFCVVGVRP
jgi:SAM-dependent methyltransferase